MSPEDAVHFITEAMVLTMILSMPPIAVAAIVGVVVSLLQALTQVQEQTLSFAIKLIAVAVTIAAMAGILGSELLSFTLQVFDDFPKVVG
ncbi:MAG: type III secretion system export apparatus subunit SctS [Pseudomonadota bacterium]